MIKTLSLCPTCYRKVEAEITFQNGMAVMTKHCEEHGPFSAIVEKDMQHVSNFYSCGTKGNNNAIIIHTHDGCNMSCPWCYYPVNGDNKHKPFSYYDAVLGMYRGFNLLMSGGEPTLRPDFFEFAREGASLGWNMAAITNMRTMADDSFFQQVLDSPLTQGDMVKFAMSMQHPKNYGDDVLKDKIKAIENLERHKKQAMCAMFSIQTLSELEWIRTWYDATKAFYPMLRIRTMFGNWRNKGAEKIWLSDLHKSFLKVFGDLNPIISEKIEKSNMYCIYLQMDGGMNVSLSSSPTVENIDYHQCSRPVFMLSEDGKCYPVPICQIVSEGIEKGYKDGFMTMNRGALCG